MGAVVGRRDAAARLADLYADLDPGGLKIALAIKTLVALVLAATLSVLFALSIPHLTLPPRLAGIDWFADAFERAKTAEGLATTLPLVAGVITLNAFLLHPTASYRAELRWFAAIAATSFTIVSAVGLAGPGSWGHGVAPVAIFWVFLITAGLYARRWGAATAKFGVMTALLGVVFVVVNPTREVGFWFPAMALIALLVTFVVRFLTIRVSAVAAFRVQTIRFLEVAADGLDAIRRGEPAPDPRAPAKGPRTLRRRWTRLQRFLPAATTEAPRIAPRLSAQIVSSYRMALAQGVVADAWGALGEERRRALLADERFTGALADLSERLTHPEVIAFPSGRIVDPRLEALLDERVDPRRGLSGEALQEVRLVAGLRRIERALNDLLEGRSEVEIATVPTESDQSAAAAQAAKSAAGRIALQALVATSITTALQLALALDHAYWATLTVALVLNGKVGQTTVKTIQRAAGTAIGVALAIALVPLVGGWLPLEIALIVLALPVIVLTIEDGYLFAAAAIGFMVTMGLHVLTGAGEATMLARVYETAIGAGVALATAWLLLPTFAASTASQEVADFLERCRAGIVSIADSRSPATVAAPLSRELQALAREVPNITAERRILGRDAHVFEEMVVLLDALVAYIGQYEASRGPVLRGDLPAQVRDALDELQARLVGAMDALLAAVRPDAEGRVPSADGQRPFEPLPLDAREILPPGLDVTPREMLAVVEHAFAGNRIGNAIDDIAGLAARIRREEGAARPRPDQSAARVATTM